MNGTFSRPQNWCDTDCERCTVAGRCTIAAQLQGAPATMPAEREANDDLPASMRRAAVGRARAAMLMRCDDERLRRAPSAAGREGRPSSRRARRLRRAGVDYLCTVARLAVSYGSHHRKADADLGHAVRLAALIAPKTARIAAFLDAEGRPASGELWRTDAVPNLLLIEHADIEVAVSLTPWFPTEEASGPIRRVREQLWQQIGPWVDAIPESARRTLANLIADRRAPSPFGRVARRTTPREEPRPRSQPRHLTVVEQSAFPPAAS